MKPKQHLEFVKVDLNAGWERPAGLPARLLAEDPRLRPRRGEKARQPHAAAEDRRRARSPPSLSCTTTGKRSTWCRATWWSATTSRARAAQQCFAPTYACRPPGVHHGPFTSRGGCILHEIHYSMLKTGSEHLESLRDGRVVYIGSERVDDVTTHPAFRNAARTVAAIYDMKLADRDAMSFEEGGERYSHLFPQAEDPRGPRAPQPRLTA